MANLSPVEMQKLETLLAMSSGYVLNFSNQEFARFLKQTIGVNIESGKYDEYGTSKAKRLRKLWETEADITVGKLIRELVEYYKAQIDLGKPTVEKVNDAIVQACFNIASRLQGKPASANDQNINADTFLAKDIDETPIALLKLPQPVCQVLEQRIVEIKKCISAGASLSVIFLCGSVLEGILLHIATSYPAKFNQSKSCPKDREGKPKFFPDWSLSSLIEVCYEQGFIGLDVKKHGHSLRDFRNYIHPFEQMSSGFSPDIHTAGIAWKVLKAAMHDVKIKSEG